MPLSMPEKFNKIIKNIPTSKKVTETVQMYSFMKSLNNIPLLKTPGKIK